MLVLTVLMLVAFLCLIPLRIAAAFRLDLNSKTLKVRATVFWIPVFKEHFEVQGKYLVCKGTVDTDVDMFAVDGKSGVNWAKAIVLDSVNVTFALDYTKMSPYAMFGVESFCATATAIACRLSHCRVHTDTCFSQDNAVFGEVVISVSLAEILLTLASESRRLRKKAVEAKARRQ